eukprot:TRINITY_DN2857_c0_g1_i2.p1 TRINITY_DN2857_c0_g1~~TRINITY_DN2857_c0_g1_i2.p1  ORF type:complete len:219 (-),score=44.19 TRINITY_DN2857_c0_g1_i2:88-744(-)
MPVNIILTYDMLSATFLSLFFLKKRRPPRSPLSSSSAASDVYKRQGKRKAECTWKIHKIHWERNRFIYNLHFVDKKISKPLYDYLCRQKIADGPLIAKWRKPGYEYLCSLSAIDTRNTNYGTSSICRVPLHLRGDRPTPSITTGCISCASTDKGVPIWWCTRMNLAKLQSKRGREPEPEVEDPEEDPEFAKRLRALRGEDEPAAAAAPVGAGEGTPAE